MDDSPACTYEGEDEDFINDFDRFPFDIEVVKLDSDARVYALDTAQTVVSLTSYSGGEELFICSGVIMECEESSFGNYKATILTSATLLRSPDGTPKLAHDLKIDVFSVGGKSINGKVVASDFYYNLAIITIDSDKPSSVARIRLVDDVVEIGCVTVSQRPNVPDSVGTWNRFRLYGDKVLALARYFQEPYDVMVASGQVSSDDCGFDCKELMKASCKIKKNGIGGPLINLHGEVIGINFYEASYTPFLPMNIVIKCFEELKRSGRVSHPSLGVVVRDLHSISLRNLEKVCKNFPHVVKGVIVDEVSLDSPAHGAGLCTGDVIINCVGASLGSRLELTEMLWGKEGEPFELIVVRPSSGEQFIISVDAVDANLKENRWPVPEICLASSYSALKTRW